jgi:hypothetical protein
VGMLAMRAPTSECSFESLEDAAATETLGMRAGRTCQAGAG